MDDKKIAYRNSVESRRFYLILSFNHHITNNPDEHNCWDRTDAIDTNAEIEFYFVNLQE